MSILTKRLWKAGIALGLFILTLTIGNSFLPRDKAVTRQSIGQDFIAFYTAGTFINSGRVNDIYDLPKVRTFQHALAQNESLEIGNDFGPFWNPPFFALMFAPLAKLPYMTAWNAWFAFNVACAAVAVVLLTRIVREKTNAWQYWALVPLLICVALPLVQALGHGQNSCLSLLLLSITATLWRKGTTRAFAAGACAGLLFYKPQLGAIVAAALILDLGWKALTGLAATGVALLGITLISLPGALMQWLIRLPGNVRFMQVERQYLWERHVTLKAFWRLLLQGNSIGDATLLTRVLTLMSIAIVAVVLLAGLIRVRRQIASRGFENGQRDRLIGATTLAMPLLMPFYFDYDLLLLAVPAVLTAAQWPARSNVSDRRMLWAWVALYAWLFVNPGIAEWTHVNGTVILLATVAGLAMNKLWQREVAEAAAQPILQAHALATAA